MGASNENLTLDPELEAIVDYVCNYKVSTREAYSAARRCFLDAIASGLYAWEHPDCTKLVGPIVPGATTPRGARVPGSRLELDPVQAAFSTGTLIRWLDFNDTFTAAQGSHPSDNAAGILSVADYESRQRVMEGRDPFRMRDVLAGITKCYEIQGCIAIENDFNAIGVDHVLLTRVATASVVAAMLGGGRNEVLSACSNAWLDSQLRVYRQAPGAGTRKGWAAADASAQGVRLAYMAMKGEMAYPQALSAKKWGFYDVYRQGKRFEFQRPYGEYVIQNAMLKFVAAGMHGQSAVECAFLQHPRVKDRIGDIEKIQIYSQRALMGIMDKTGPLRNIADRDHSVQYIVALGLLNGRLHPKDYDDYVAADPRIDALREKMVVTEDPDFSKGFYDPAKRSSANGIQIFFRDGTSTPRVDVEYPAGHPRRRAETVDIFRKKFVDSLELCFAPRQRDIILAMCEDQERFEATPVNEFMDALVV
jgi:2-methylcitrate dehydratase